MEIPLTLSAQGVLLSPFGFEAAVNDIGLNGASPAAVLGDVAPVVQTLHPFLQDEGLDTKSLDEVFLNIAAAQNSIDSHLALLKMRSALQGFGSDVAAYRRATNSAMAAKNFRPSVTLPSPMAQDLLRFAQSREEAAEKQRSAIPYSEKYRELGRIGQGEQAEIFLVEDAATGEKFIARKLLRADDLGRLYDYYRALQNLDHPNIVKGHEIIAETNEASRSQLILIMEVAPGKSLAEYLAEGKIFNEEQIKEIYRQLLSALKHAWSQRIIHRDLKPSNIIVDVGPGGEIRRVTLLDFGVAKIAGDQTSESSAGKGTLIYQAPEQLKGGPITIATDIHGLGLVLLDLIAGHVRKNLETVDEGDRPPAEDFEKLRKKGFDSPLLAEVEIMLNRDPEVRLSILGAEVADFATLSEAQLEMISGKVVELVRVGELGLFHDPITFGSIIAMASGMTGMTVEELMLYGWNTDTIGATAGLLYGSIFAIGMHFALTKHNNPKLPFTGYLHPLRYIAGALAGGLGTFNIMLAFMKIAGTPTLPTSVSSLLQLPLGAALLGAAHWITRRGRPARVAKRKRKELELLEHKERLHLIAETHPKPEVRLLAARALAQMESNHHPDKQQH